MNILGFFFPLLSFIRQCPVMSLDGISSSVEITHTNSLPTSVVFVTVSLLVISGKLKAKVSGSSS